MTFDEFARLARPMHVRDCGNGHWQVKGVRLVNFYPSTGTVFMEGTALGVPGDAVFAIYCARHGKEPSLFDA